MARQMQVAIIGSGCSGLTAIKACLDEGLNPVCFESTDDIGGLWRFSHDVPDGRGCVASTTVVNTSKEMMAFSDFPPPKEFPNFMYHTKVVEYFRRYSDRFDLRPHIRFNTHVEHIQPNSDNNNNNDNVSESLTFGNFSDKVYTHITKEDNKEETSTRQNKIHLADDSCLKRANTKHNSYPNDLNDLNNIEQYQDPTGNKTKLRLRDEEPDMNCNYKSTLNQNIDVGDAVDKIPKECFDNRKAWIIRIQEKSTGRRHILYFDAVLVCTGHHAYINMPEVQGQSDFKGNIVHSRDVREPDKLCGSRHLVVGVGNSGCDMAVEISRKSKVFLSTRRGTWLMHRLQTKGLPADIAFSNRFVFATAFSLPNRLLNYFSAQHLNKKIDHDLYGLRPRHGPIAAHPTVNDELPNRVACGQVVVKPNIQKLLKNGVLFEDGTFEQDIDTVIMATGYHIKFPFLDESIISTKSNNIPLYLYMFPTSEVTRSLAIIGCVQPGGALAPVAEMQCRLAVKVFKGECKLPNRDLMEQDIENRRRGLEDRYVHSPRHTIQVDYIPYMDSLASMVGCKPNLGRILISDPLLAARCIFGPCTAYQYRLHGPQSWTKARESIMTQMDRVNFPLMTRQCRQEEGSSSRTFLLILAMIFGIILGSYSHFIS